MTQSLKALVASILLCEIANAELVTDPIKDFLSLPIADRYTEASSVARVDQVLIDIDLDGTQELFIGHSKMWLGDNNGVYFSIYKRNERGYTRLTAEDEDIRLQLHDGQPKFIFVGKVDELGETGLLICNSPQGDGELSNQRIESRTFVFVIGNSIKSRELPGLDLKNKDDLDIYKKYFPKPGHQGGYQSESLTVEELTTRGVKVPDWTKMPSANAQHKLANSKGSGTSIETSKQLKAHAPGVQEAPMIQNSLSAKNLWSIACGVLLLAAASLCLFFKNRRQS